MSNIAIDDNDSDNDIFSPDAILSMLSPEARAALEQLKQQQQQQQQQHSNSNTAATSAGSNVSEDYGMSQFWYTTETSDLLALESWTLGGLLSINDLTTPRRIACISCPSLFIALQRLEQKLLSENNINKQSVIEYYVLEYDSRFNRYGSQFIYYDYNQPQNIPTVLHHSFDYIIADPPYINTDCMSLTSTTMQLLSRNKSTTKLLFNTGAILAVDIELLMDMKPTVIKPEHSCLLMNEFRSYTNYNSNRLGGWDKE